MNNLISCFMQMPFRTHVAKFNDCFSSWINRYRITLALIECLRKAVPLTHPGFEDCYKLFWEPSAPHNHGKAGPLQWRHNEGDSVSNRRSFHCLLNVCLGADERKHQSPALLAFVRGIHRSPMDSPHTGPVARKCFHLMTSYWQDGIAATQLELETKIV